MSHSCIATLGRSIETSGVRRLSGDLVVNERWPVNRPTRTATGPSWGNCVRGADRDRTDDLRLAKPALSQLSYSPERVDRAPLRSPGRSLVRRDARYDYWCGPGQS